MKKPEPTRLEYDTKQRALLCDWSDGHPSTYPVRYLRGFCPCAGCQGHGRGDWIFQASKDEIDIASMDEVGNYALGVTYNDGHSTGIYSWDILRELCPCESCRIMQGAKHALSQTDAEIRKSLGF